MYCRVAVDIVGVFLFPLGPSVIAVQSLLGRSRKSTYEYIYSDKSYTVVIMIAA